MKISFVSILVSLLLCYDVYAQSEINLHIKNLNSDSVLINIGPIADPESGKIDTIILKNGKVKYRFKVKEASQAVIIPFDLFHRFKNGTRKTLPGSRVIFFLNENDPISIDATIEDKIISYQIKGNKLSEQLANAHRDKAPVFKNRYQFELAYNEKKKQENTPEEEKQYMANIGANNLAYQTANLLYAKKHPANEASAFLLLQVKAQDSVASLYPKLSKEVQNSYYGKILGNLVLGWNSTKPGQKLPIATATTITGNPILFSDYKGKFMLLDFWGSWCGPCISELPTLKAFNQKHQDKLVLLGLICKDTKDNAQAAIDKYNLQWQQLYSAKDEFGPLFGITGYPTKILIDPNGIVLKTYIGVNATMMDEIASIINK